MIVHRMFSTPFLFFNSSKRWLMFLLCTISTSTLHAQLRGGMKEEERIAAYAPSFEEMQRDFPNPVLDHRPELLRAYWGGWWWMDVNTEHREGLENIEPHYISAAYGTNAFSWDTSTMILFARYAWKTRPTIVAMNNFYRNPAGTKKGNFVMPHEILGLKRPSGIPPQILCWAEWEHYLSTGDKERLQYALPFLVKNFDSLKKILQVKQSTFPLAYKRIHKGVEVEAAITKRRRAPLNNGSPLGGDSLSAVETMAQMAHSALCMARMAEAIGDEELTTRMMSEYEQHIQVMQNAHWDPERKFFMGRAVNGEFFPFYQASNFWPWLAEGTQPEQDIEMMVALFDPTRYRLNNFVPTTSFDNVRWFTLNDGKLSGSTAAWHAATGGFWQGGAWPPTNQMVIRGLRNSGYPELAREVSMDVLTWSIEHALKGRFDQPLSETNFKGINVYAEHFGTQFRRRESRNGKLSFRLIQSGVKSGHFVGWSGGPVINGILEELIGIFPDAPNRTITWNLNELPRHGLTNLHLGDATVDLIARDRSSLEDDVVLEVKTDQPFTLKVRLGATQEEKQFGAGAHEWKVGAYQNPLADVKMGPADFSATGGETDPRWVIQGISLGMSMEEVKAVAGETRWFNKPLTLFGHHYADRLSVFPEGKMFINVILNAEGKVIMVWTPDAPDGEADARLASLTEQYGEPVAEWRHPEYGYHQFLAWGDAHKDAFGHLDNGISKPSLLIYNAGKGNISTQRHGARRQGGTRLWDPVGIEKMREGLRMLLTEYVTRANQDK